MIPLQKYNERGPLFSISNPFLSNLWPRSGNKKQEFGLWAAGATHVGFFAVDSRIRCRSTNEQSDDKEAAMTTSPKLIERKPYMQILRDVRDEHIIKVVTGMRRCGKSTLLAMFADELRHGGVPSEQILVYNFEDLDTLAIGDMMSIYRHITARLCPNKINYVFLDEPQNILSFERLIDSLYIKNNVDIYVTGSNAKLLSGELATLLTGRYIEIAMLPFSFSEYCQMKTTAPNISKIECLAQFIYDGGIPQTVMLSERSERRSDEFVSGILKTIIEKDILIRHGRTNRAAFERILDFVLDSTGSPISPRSIADTLKSNGVNIDKSAIARYLEYLQEAFLLYKVARYDLKGKNLLQTLNKYYISDPAFRKTRLRRKRGDDRGHLLENAVYLELLRRNREVYTGKFRDKEIDFVAVDGSGYISYYQVAYAAVEHTTLERELAPLRAIRDSYPKFLISADVDHNPVYDGIKKLNAADWFLDEVK
jgi:predicted AAA+ superfamily ATPase